MLKKLIFSLIVAIAVSRIYLVNPMTHLVGDFGDSYEFLGFMHIAKENIKEHYFPFVDSNILRYPTGFGFSYGYDGGFAVLTGGLLGLAGSQILAYNLTLVLILFLNLFVSVYCFYRIALLFEVSQAELKAYIAGVIFALSPYALARINSHLNLAFIAGFPLFLYGLVVLFDKFTKQLNFVRLDFARILFGLLLVSLGSLQYMILIGYCSLVAVLVVFVVPAARKYKSIFRYVYDNSKNGMWEVAIAILGLFLFFYWGYFFALLNGDLVYVNPASRGIHVATPIDLVLPNPYSGQIYEMVSPSDYSIERVAAIGVLELLFLAYLMIKSFRAKSWFLGSFGVLVAYIVVALNLFSVPLYPEGGRFVVIVSLMLGLVMIRFLNVTNAKLLVVLLVLLLSERLTFDVKSHPVPDFSFSDTFSADTSVAVLNVPVDKYNSMYSALPYFYGGKKIYDGYFHHTASNATSERYLVGEAPLAKFVCSPDNSFLPSAEEFQETIGFLVENQTRYIVLYKQGYNSKFYYDSCANVRSAWYWFNAPRLDLWESSPDVRYHTFELPIYQKHLKAEIFMQKSGIFSLNGLYTNPIEFNNLKITLPDGQEVFPEFQILNNGNRVEFIPPLTYEVQAGDFVTISSDVTIDDNKYVTLYYVYEAWVDEDPKKSHLIENVYSNENVDVYRLNYE